MLTSLSSIRKALVSALGVALTALTFAHAFTSFLPGSASTWIGVVLAVLTPIVTYLTPNKTTTAATPAA